MSCKKYFALTKSIYFSYFLVSKYHVPYSEHITKKGALKIFKILIIESLSNRLIHILLHKKIGYPYGIHTKYY